MKKGFTLLEVSITLAIFCVVVVLGLNVVSYVVATSQRLAFENFVFGELSVALDFIDTHVKEATEISIKTDEWGILDEIELRINQLDTHARLIKYRPTEPPVERLMFGGTELGQGWQEVAREISEIQVTRDDSIQMLYVTIKNEPTGQVLYLSIDVSAKRIIDK